MKKIDFLLLIFLFFSFCAPAFSTEFSAGMTFDRHDTVLETGTSFSVTESFADNSSLSAGIAYKESDTYTANILVTEYLGVFVLSGGLNHTLKPAGITQDVSLGTGLVFKKVSILASGSVNINPDSLFKPEAYSYTGDFIFDTSEAIVDLKFQYAEYMQDSEPTTSVGGGFIFTAYKAGAPADIDIILNTDYTSNNDNSQSAFSVSAGIGVNIYLPFMNLHVKTMADVMSTHSIENLNIPFKLSVGTSFKF